jgi:glucose 1-dehydrogenase
MDIWESRIMPHQRVRGQPLAGQKALITGANSGIGKAVAIAMAEAGASVVVNYVTGDDEAHAVAH